MGHPPRAAVMGTGSVGLAVAGVLSLSGFDVSLYELPQFASSLEAIAEQGGIRVHGAYGEGLARPQLVTSDIGEAIAGRKILLFCIPAYADEAFTKACAPHLRDGQILVYLSCYGALRMSRYLQELDANARVVTCETMSCFYVAGKCGVADINVARKKEGLLFSAFPGRVTADALQQVGQLFPDLVPAKNSLETSIHNTNPLFHPTSSVMNAGWIEATHGEFNFALEGFTPSVVRLQQATDQERLKVCKALNLSVKSSEEWILGMYHLPDMSSLRPNPSASEKPRSNAPSDLSEHRYMLEDVPYGLVPISSLAEQLHIPIPLIDSVIELSSIIVDDDLRLHGVTSQDLGLAGLNAKEMSGYLETGNAVKRTSHQQ